MRGVGCGLEKRCLNANRIHTVGHYVNDEFGFNNDLFKYGENSLEHILFEIENIQLRVQRLKDQLDMVMLANGVKLSSWDNLSLLVSYDAQTSSVPEPQERTMR
ncbi:hypothetical protein Ancab_022651 [Ancistrocladus abbreviatus]